MGPRTGRFAGMSDDEYHNFLTTQADLEIDAAFYIDGSMPADHVLAFTRAYGVDPERAADFLSTCFPQHLFLCIYIYIFCGP